MSGEALETAPFGSKSTKTLTAKDKGSLPIGDQTFVKGDLVLIKDQASAKDNGIYVVDHPGCDASNFVLKRHTSHCGTPGSPVLAGDVAYVTVVKKGQKFTTEAYQQTTKGHPKTGIQVDKDPQAWVKADTSKSQADQSKSGKGIPQPIDSHKWDANAEEGEMLDATEDLVKRAMIKQNFGQSEIPGGFKTLLEDIAARKAELNYKGIILSAIKRHASGHDRTGTWTRPSRRYGVLAAGTKESQLPKLSLFCDSSGSISTEELNDFLEIVSEFLRCGARKCELNLFHTTNYYSAPYKRGDKFDPKKVESGGTDLTDSFKKIIETNPDLSLVLTDGFYTRVEYEKMLRPNQKCPQILFLISKDGQENHPLAADFPTIKIPNTAKLKSDKELEKK